jgi:hypothetical protein
MEEGKSLINVGELSKPATVLIEKISEAVGGIFRPYQIRRVAEAEVDAEKIKAISKIEVTDIQRRAMQRFLEEEAKKQENIESITSKALPAVGENSFPQKIENDWLANFFDKCRLISDDEMQNLWAKVLAGEANAPGHFSKRTISVLASLDKQDAELFQKLCSFAWWIMDEAVPLIYENELEDNQDPEQEPYSAIGINFETLKHLNEIGLMTYDGISGFSLTRLRQQIEVFYYGSQFVIEFPQPNGNKFDTGRVLLSKVGQDLAPLCESKPNPNFEEYIIKKWKSFGLKVSAVENSKNND